MKFSASVEPGLLGLKEIFFLAFLVCFIFCKPCVIIMTCVFFCFLANTQLSEVKTCCALTQMYLTLLFEKATFSFTLTHARTRAWTHARTHARTRANKLKRTLDQDTMMKPECNILELRHTRADRRQSKPQKYPFIWFSPGQAAKMTLLESDMCLSFYPQQTFVFYYHENICITGENINEEIGSRFLIIDIFLKSAWFCHPSTNQWILSWTNHPSIYAPSIYPPINLFLHPSIISSIHPPILS